VSIRLVIIDILQSAIGKDVRSRWDAGEIQLITPSPVVRLLIEGPFIDTKARFYFQSDVSFHGTTVDDHRMIYHC
jgi:hypothetical protein